LASTSRAAPNARPTASRPPPALAHAEHVAAVDADHERRVIRARRTASPAGAA
jgi:hypothetical protein